MGMARAGRSRGSQTPFPLFHRLHARTPDSTGDLVLHEPASLARIDWHSQAPCGSPPASRPPSLHLLLRLLRLVMADEAYPGQSRSVPSFLAPFTPFRFCLSRVMGASALAVSDHRLLRPAAMSVTTQPPALAGSKERRLHRWPNVSVSADRSVEHERGVG
jgi:hypothetical protein